jgi:L-threonylcarbamoyladenylate synthase
MSAGPRRTPVVSIERDGAELARGELLRCLARGGVAVFPADGLYGLGCDPLDDAAVGRIHALKGRGERKPSAVMYLDPIAMRELLAGLGPRAADAVAVLLPGPVTLVLPNPDRRYPLACRQDPERLGVRLIEGPLAGMPLPMFQTSANLSGEPAPSRLEDVPEPIRAAADLAIDAGELTGRPSTVVDVSALDSGGEWSILREGAMEAAEIDRRLTGIIGPSD